MRHLLDHARIAALTVVAVAARKVADRAADGAKDRMVAALPPQSWATFTPEQLETIRRHPSTQGRTGWWS